MSCTGVILSHIGGSGEVSRGKNKCDIRTISQNIGLREAGLKRPEIQKRVRKKDGKRPSLQSLDCVLEWDGVEVRTAGGRPCGVTPQQAKKIPAILLRDVGKRVVSAASDWPAIALMS